jgi:hypothetical protein
MVRLGDHGFVGHIDPFAIEPHAIVSVAGLPIDIADRGAVGVGATRPLPALQALEPRFQFGVGVGILAAVARMPEMGSEPQQHQRKTDRQRRFQTPRAPAVRILRAFIFRSSSVYKRGALPPESIQSLTCRLLQHPPASAATAKHFACQLFGRLCPLHFSVVQHGLIPADFASGTMSAVNLPR